MNTQPLNASLAGLSDRPWISIAIMAFILALGMSTPVWAHGDEGNPTSPRTSTETMSPAGTKATHASEPSSSAIEIEHGEGKHSYEPENHHGEATAAEAAHDHSAHGPNEALLRTGFGRFLVWLGKFHPAAVHFPIALLLAAAAAEILSMRYRPEFFQNAARFSLWGGALGALGAASLGWLYGGFRLIDEESLMIVHRWNGTGLTGVALLTLWLNERRIRRNVSQRGGYRTALFVTAVLVGLNGFLGGLMVYGPEQHQWPSPPAAHSH